MKGALQAFLLIGLVGAEAAAQPAGDGSARAAVSATAAARELIADSHFRRGFILLDPQPGKQVPYGKLSGPERAEPVWKLAQWSSRFPLAAAAPGIIEGGALCWRNDAKAVTLGGPSPVHADLTLQVNSQPEYGEHTRQAREPWVHLLAEQRFRQPPSLDELHSLTLHLEARLLESRRFAMDGYSPHLHAAHFQVFLTLQNLNRQSAGYGKYLWFGIPVYDDRCRIPRAHKTRDTGGTGMFIYTEAGETYTGASLHDGRWVTLEKDLRPLLQDALAMAWSRGFLSESQEQADYRVASVNLGWELPGTFAVALQVRNLSLQAVPTP